MLDTQGHDLTEDLAQARVVRQMLGMQQLGPQGLSEQWVLGFCGDAHWALIARSIRQEGLCFRTIDGRPLYAAFCATRLELSETGPLLGEDLVIRSELSGTGGAKIGSRHVFLHRGQEIGRLLMLSTFVAHDTTGSNRRITRALPARQYELPPAGPDLMALDARARQVSRGVRGQTVAAESAEQVTPSFPLDFNAVGLLYFPSFSRIIEQVARTSAPLRMREVIYLGNLDPGDTLRVQRKGAETRVARDCGRIIAQAREDRSPAALNLDG